MNKKILITAILLGLTSIILGAFASHGLKDSIEESSLRSFEIGVKHQIYHAMFLFFIAQFNFLKLKIKQIIYYLTVVGVLFFSVSIYFLSTSTITGLDLKSIAFLTPIGGLLLIFAWSVLLFAVFKEKMILSQK